MTAGMSATTTGPDADHERVADTAGQRRNDVGEP
jgi:hypothetical protein